MIEGILTKLTAILIAPVLFIGGLFIDEQIDEQAVGVDLPTGTAVFESSLSAPITSSATSLTLASNSVRGGDTLSGYECFTVDEGTSIAEFICGTVSGLSVTGLVRGINPSNGTSTVAALQFAHRRGASVKITDFPLIQRMRQQLSGNEAFEAPIRYNSLSTSTIGDNNNYLASVGYVNAIAFDTAGVVAATESASGFSELATRAEMAAGTQTGGSGEDLVVQSRYSSSTRSSSVFYNVITLATGFISETFFPKTLTEDYTFSGDTTFSGSVSYASSTTVRVYTSSDTWTKPANLSYITVEVVGGGGGGGGNTTVSTGAGGGGGGGYAKEVLTVDDLSATSSVLVTIGTGGTAGIGTGGTGGTGGTSYFSTFLNAAGGTGGTGGTGAGGAGGAGSNGDFNLTGGGGGSGDSTASRGGVGGSSFFGGGARGTVSASANGGNYGGGGSGAASSGGDDTPGGTGGQGVVVVTEYFN